MLEMSFIEHGDGPLAQESEAARWIEEEPRFVLFSYVRKIPLPVLEIIKPNFPRYQLSFSKTMGYKYSPGIEVFPLPGAARRLLSI